MIGHPSEPELRDFLAERTAGERRDAIADHVENCPLCQQVLESLTAKPALVMDSAVTTDGGAHERRSATEPHIETELLAGRYRLLHPIGEGGMGVVWSADQVEPLKRRVAVKVIKPGMDSAAVLRRFEAERQALALMDHPSIARVFDGGATSDGRPFFAMEFVDGPPLTKYCDDARLGIGDRLRLFGLVCQAVQHAHQKGVVHRDLKPTNILVAHDNGRPVPKVIDFGVAKAVGAKLLDESVDTQFGTVVGTLEYMSPEQAGFSASDVDTRADVYSLGVILYELLTGLRPIDGKRLRAAAVGEMIRILHEEEPSKPSTRLSTADALPSVAALRQTEPRRLVTILRGDLDWVVMKCLEKERERRYESAAALARDIDRHLTHEPVEARPPSATYRARKFLRRHRLPVLAASLVLMALVAGVIGTSWGMFKANRAANAERDAKLEAQARRDEAERQKARAEANEKLAGDRLIQVEAEKRAAEAVQHFLEDDLLTQADAWRQADALRQIGGGFAAQFNPTIRELLDRAAVTLSSEKIEAKFPGQPLVQASVLFTIGKTYNAIGEFAKSGEHLRRAHELFRATVGPNDSRTTATLQARARAAQNGGEHARSVELFRELIATLVGNRSADDPEVLAAKSGLGSVLWMAGKSDEAVTILEEVVAAQTRQLGASNDATLTSMEILGLIHQRARRYAKAMPLFIAVRDARVRDLGLDHAKSLIAEENVGLSLMESGKPAQAIPILERLRQPFDAQFGADHPTTMTVYANLAKAYLLTGRVTDALPLLERTYNDAVRLLGPRHPDTFTYGNDLALGYRFAGKFPESVALFEKVRDAQSAVLGPDHANTVVTCANLVRAYESAERPADVIKLAESLRDTQLPSLPADNPMYLGTFHCLAQAYRKTGRPGDAIVAYETARQRIARELGPDHKQALAVTRNLVAVHDAAEDWSRAEPLFRELLERYSRINGPTDALTMSTAIDLGNCLVRQKKWGEAEKVLRQGLEDREKATPDAFGVMQMKSLLGESLSGQRRFEDAEPLLLTGYEGLKQREAKMPPKLRAKWLADAAERLARHYEDRGDSQLAEKWKREAANPAAKP